MNGLNDERMITQTFLYGCVLEPGKEVFFNPEDDDFEHQLDLRMACADSTTKDEFHQVEIEGEDSDGQKVTAALVSLKPSTLPSVCLGGFTITPPAVFRLKAGSGPIHISGQHLIMMETDRSFEEEDDDDDEEEEEEEEEEEDLKTSKKRPLTSPVSKSQKKMKMQVDAEEDDDDEDGEEETPVKAKQMLSKPQKSAQNGKGSKASTPTPAGKGSKASTPTPAGKGSKASTPTPRAKTPKGKKIGSPKTPVTPREPLTLPEIQAKMTEAMKKGVALPKLQPKFENFVKNSFKVSDAKVIGELWKWTQAQAETK
ncbi:nucleophosmin 1a [Nerophis lumbriciformis]|uniref:nucleophosmin 1a n=1 Tax=Nerophis lumbriciformis TaxID=546530 RepID=UPI002ADFDCDA|nr:nucleophosmin-like [Nerophis lumbriciformis]